MPVTDEIFVKGIYNEMVQDGLIKETTASLINAVMPHINVKKSRVFVGGKTMVGPLALAVTGLSVKQADALKPLSNVFVSDAPHSTKLYFKDLQDSYSASAITDREGNIILEALSQALSIAVDNVKNPVADDMYMNIQTIGIISYLLTRRVDPATILYFIKQPIIKDYLDLQKTNESLFNKQQNNEKSKNQLIQTIATRYKLEEQIEYPEDWSISKEQLKKDVKTKQNQGYYFNYFLELVEQAKAWGEFNSTQNSDTASIKDRQMLLEKQQTLNKVLLANLVPKDEVFRINNSGVVAPFYKYGRLTYNIYTPFYSVESSKIGSPLKQFKFRLLELVRKNDKDRVVQTLENDFLTYVIQNYVLDPNDRERLMKGSNSLPHRILEAKSLLPNNLILKAFTPLLNHTTDPIDGKLISNLRLFDRDLNVLDQNDMLIQVEEIATVNPELYSDLVKFLFYQSGLNISPFNYRSVIPVGLESDRSKNPSFMYEYQDIITAAVNKVQELDPSEFETFQKLFELNNPKYLRSKKVEGLFGVKKVKDGKIKILLKEGTFNPRGTVYQRDYVFHKSDITSTQNDLFPSTEYSPAITKTLEDC